MPGVYHCELGRVENSKTFQNQMAQCFFIGLYDIETGDDFFFFYSQRWALLAKGPVFGPQFPPIKILFLEKIKIIPSFYII